MENSLGDNDFIERLTLLRRHLIGMLNAIEKQLEVLKKLADDRKTIDK